MRASDISRFTAPRAFAVLLLGVSMLVAVPAVRADQEGDFTYTEHSPGKATITDYTGTNSSAISIPAVIGNGLSVTSIGYDAFYGCINLKSVTIPDGVTKIGSWSFYRCANLTEITIPSSVTSIDGYAFFQCTGLTSVTIPNGVSSIGYESFSSCTGLKSITIPGSLASIGGKAFSGCSGLTSITIQPGVTSIADYAFADCTGVTSIILPSSVINIGGGAFFGCTSLGSITIPNSVTCIGDNAFFGCSGLTSVVIPSSVTNIGGGAFFGCTRLGSITIPNSITSIGSNAFFGCSGLTNVVIPSSVTDIGSQAFMSAGLTSITIPNGVRNIGSNAFTGCIDLTSVTIPTSVTKIDDGVFCDCFKLKDVTIPSSVTSIGRYAFARCKGLTNIQLSYGVTTVGYGAFSECTGLTSVTIPATVTNIDPGAFSNCTSLTSVKIPSSVASIGGHAFDGCNNLADITVADGEAYIPPNACAWGNLLTNITIANSVTFIGDGAFSSCATRSVTLPNNLTQIGTKAFSNCLDLLEIVIPRSVGYIGAGAFSYCTQLAGIQVAEDNPYYCSVDGVLFDKSKTTLMLYPAGKIGRYTVPDGVTCICDSAFSGCTGLSDVTLPRSVTRIGNQAFSGCTGLIRITIPGSVTSIGSNAFAGCSGMQAAFFQGISPVMGTEIFSGVTTNFAIYYLAGQVGYTPPLWQGYSCAAFTSSPPECTSLSPTHGTGGGALGTGTLTLNGGMGNILSGGTVIGGGATLGTGTLTITTNTSGLLLFGTTTVMRGAPAATVRDSVTISAGTLNLNGGAYSTNNVLLNVASGTIALAQNGALTSNTGQSATIVVIEGTNFCNVTAVNFGATPATAFTVNSTTQITATVPYATPGTIVDVMVTTPFGTSSPGENTQFIYDDTTPDSFSFSAVTGVEINMPCSSPPVTITGINTVTPISISSNWMDAQYQVNGGAWTSTAGTVQNNDQVAVRMISAATYNTTKSATLTIGGVSATFTVATRMNTPPTVALAAGTAANPITGTAVALGVLGADDGGEAALTYTWAVTDTPSAAVSFSENGTNVAKNTTAIFSKPGIYNFEVTIKDAGNLTVTSSLSVTVEQAVTSISVTSAPTVAIVDLNGTQRFTASATDQFGDLMNPQPIFTWSATGAGTMNGAVPGEFLTGTAAGAAVIMAASGTVSGTAAVRVASVTEFPLQLVQGWNLLSLPIEPVTPNVTDVFPAGTLCGCAWEWDANNKHYSPLEQVHPFTGYWVYAPKTKQILVRGAKATSPQVNLAKGWNLVGPEADSAPALPETYFWGWKTGSNGRFFVEQHLLQAGSGYWIYIPQAMTWNASTGAPVPE